LAEYEALKHESTDKSNEKQAGIASEAAVTKSTAKDEPKIEVAIAPAAVESTKQTVPIDSVSPKDTAASTAEIEEKPKDEICLGMIVLHVHLAVLFWWHFLLDALDQRRKRKAEEEASPQKDKKTPKKTKKETPEKVKVTDVDVEDDKGGKKKRKPKKDPLHSEVKYWAPR
jgi:hypothetical protein